MTARDQHSRIQKQPQGYMQELSPLYQKSTTKAVLEASAETALPPASLFVSLAASLRAAFGDLAKLRVRYTVLHGEKAERLLKHVQAVACEQMDLLEQQAHQQQQLTRLRRLYVECRGALVTVRGVCGLAETGLLLCDHTGTYWQFGNALLLLKRSCEDLAIHYESLKQSCSAYRELSA